MVKREIITYKTEKLTLLHDDDDDDMYLLTLLTIYMIQINQNIYNNYNHIERVRTSGIGLRPSGLKWKKK